MNADPRDAAAQAAGPFRDRQPAPAPPEIQALASNIELAASMVRSSLTTWSASARANTPDHIARLEELLGQLKDREAEWKT